MRVLHLIRADELGGAERVLLNGIPAMRQVGIEADVGLLAPAAAESPFVRALREEEIPFLRMEDPGRISPVCGLRLLSWLRRGGYDVLHVHGYRASAYGLVAARMAGCRIAVTRHGVLSRNAKERMVERLELLAANQMDAVIPVAAHLGEGVTARCHVITNGVPVPALDACAAPAIIPRKLLFVGRLSPEKNVPLLLEVMERLWGTFPGLTLDVVGDGPLRGSLTRQAQGMGLADVVSFHGFCRPEPFYRRSDVLVMTSRREGLPMVALEAMVRRLPVVATGVGGLPGLLGGELPGGLVSPSHSVDGFCGTLSRVLRSPGLGRLLGGHGRKKVVDEYSVLHWARQHMALYESLM